MTDQNPAAAHPTGVVIETERLLFRAYHDDDLAEMVALAGNWEVACWLTNLPHPYNDGDGRDWIAHVRREHATGRPRTFAIALKSNERLIGGRGLDGSRGDSIDEPALGYWLGHPYWRRGFGGKPSRRSSTMVFARWGSRRFEPVPIPPTSRRKKFRLRAV